MHKNKKDLFKKFNRSEIYNMIIFIIDILMTVGISSFFSIGYLVFLTASNVTINIKTLINVAGLTSIVAIYIFILVIASWKKYNIIK